MYTLLLNLECNMNYILYDIIASEMMSDDTTY